MAADKSPGAKYGREGTAAEPRLSLRALNIALAVVGASLFVAVALLFHIQWQQRSWLLSAQENQEPTVAALIQELGADLTRLRETLNPEQVVDVAAEIALLQASVYATEPLVRIIPFTGISFEGEVFHGDEAQDINNGEEWIAIVKKNEGYTAKKTKVFVTIVKDDLLDEPKGPFTGKKISFGLKWVEEIVFLVSGLDLPIGVQIPSVKTTKTPTPTESYNELTLEAGSSIELEGITRNIILKGMGDVQLKTGDHETNTGYQLIGMVGSYQFTIMEAFGLDDTTPHLIWTGDLNQDGYPDFLINISEKYSMSQPALFLSQNKEGKVSYKKIAERIFIAC